MHIVGMCGLVEDIRVASAPSLGLTLQPLQLRGNLASAFGDRVSQVFKVPRHRDERSTRDSLRDRHDMLALRQTARTGADSPDIQSQGGSRAAKRVSVHTQFSCRLALIAVVF